MVVSPSQRGSRNGSRAEAGPASTAAAGPARAAAAGELGIADRSHLLRRTARSASATESGNGNGNGGVRLRRGRRVNASFSAIPALSRNGRH